MLISICVAVRDCLCLTIGNRGDMFSRRGIYNLFLKFRLIVFIKSPAMRDMRQNHDGSDLHGTLLATRFSLVLDN